MIFFSFFIHRIVVLTALLALQFCRCYESSDSDAMHPIIMSLTLPQTTMRIGCNLDVSVSQWARAFFFWLYSWWNGDHSQSRCWLYSFFSLLFRSHCVLMLASPFHIRYDWVWLPWFNLKSYIDCNSFVDHVNRTIAYAIASSAKKEKKRPIKSGKNKRLMDDIFHWNNFIFAPIQTVVD